MKLFILFVFIFPIVAWGQNQKERVDQACSGSGKILVIDVFSQNQPDWGRATDDPELGILDIDGDGPGDISHGDLIAQILRNNDQEIMTYGIRAFTGHFIHGALADVRYLIESGRMAKPKAIVMAISFAVTPEWVSQVIFNSEQIVTKDNLAQLLPVIQDSILNKLNRRDKLYWALKEIKHLINETGVEFISPAGNDYSLKINVAALVGAVTLGAWDSSGTHPAPYSNQSSLTQVYRNGDIISKALPGGVDINGDGVVDFSNEILSGGTSIAQRYNGEPAILKTREEVVSNLDQEALISNRMFNELMGIEDEDLLDQIVENYGEVVHYPSQTPFKIDEQNNLFFDPEGTGDASQVAFLPGTSFSLGNVCPTSR